jgi:hypothetical protein
MVTRAVSREDLRACDGFGVESAEGTIGWVEEVWLDDADEPEALAIRTTEGRRALLRVDDIESLDTEYGWVVVGPEPRLLELDAPRVDGSLVASWGTTGNVLPVPSAPGLADRVLRRSRPRRARREERPIWQVVGVLYGVLVLLIVGFMTLAFLVAYLVTGSAY